ncbi:MAG: DUF1707 SHOCT-like domain-containing protein [Jiangellaceae bacterium]
MPTREILRAADADRDAIVERLASAMGEGRLRPEEYPERVEQAYSAKTYAELDRLVADLPGPAPAVDPSRRSNRGRCCCW